MNIVRSKWIGNLPPLNHQSAPVCCGSIFPGQCNDPQHDHDHFLAFARCDKQAPVATEMTNDCERNLEPLHTAHIAPGWTRGVEWDWSMTNSPTHLHLPSMNSTYTATQTPNKTQIWRTQSNATILTRQNALVIVAQGCDEWWMYRRCDWLVNNSIASHHCAALLGIAWHYCAACHYL